MKVRMHSISLFCTLHSIFLFSFQIAGGLLKKGSLIGYLFRWPSFRNKDMRAFVLIPIL